MAEKKRKAIPIKVMKGAVIRVSRDVNIVINRRPRVVPGRIHAFNGQVLTWWNNWINPIAVAVPFGVDGAPFLLTIAPGGGEPAPGVVDGPRGADIVYFVIDAVTGRPIHGNSPPEIVIE